MEWVLLVFVMFTSFLFFIAILQILFLSNRRMEKRMKRYLEVPNRKMLDPKKFNLILQLQLTKQKVRKKMLTKGKTEKLEALLKRAGVPLKPEEYIMFQWIMMGLIGGVLFLLSGKGLFLIVGFFLGFMIPRWWLNKKQRDRVRSFNDGLADTITTIVGSLRAGFSFPQALKTVVEEAHSPIKEEIEQVVKEMQYGTSMEDALLDLKERMPSEDLDLMIQAILIQRQVGGNLATVLDKIVQTIRDRTRIERQIHTLTAQGRLSGIVIGLLPIILGFVIYLIEPGYIGPLFEHPIGLLMVGGGAISGIVGFIMIKKLTTIEV
ncbi:type II secretion system F family protein [Calidifontibacillus oryziterrae]|uniref:type II secretion system F family protein n=1 Tax=Calidifontibacillus oryziterrae TaxID=1191699 RepID=UPI0002FC89E7|nr:type II secretion system F family protein [Calidifontibacillus oryziterrae]